MILIPPIIPIVPITPMKIIPAIFEEREIRRLYDEKTETWFFSVVDIIQVLTQQPDFQTARNYWKVLKNRLAKEGSQSVTNCNRLKLPAADGKKLPHRCRQCRNLAAPRPERSQPQGRTDQTLARQSRLRADAGNVRPRALSRTRPRHLAEARSQRKMDPAAHDRAGNP